MVNQRRVPALFSVAMDHVRAIGGKIGAAWEKFSHKSTSSSAAAAVGPLRPPSVPSAWFGAPCGDWIIAELAFPCIGAACVTKGAWHVAGTRCQPYRDVNFAGEAEEFQHMCSACSDAKRGEWRWDTYHRPSKPQASVEPEIVSDEEMHRLAAAEEAEFDMHMAAVDAVECRGCDGEAAEQQQQQQDGVRFLTHAEERAALGKPIWAEAAGQIPRVQHDGRLAMPRQGALYRTRCIVCDVCCVSGAHVRRDIDRRMCVGGGMCLVLVLAVV